MIEYMDVAGKEKYPKLKDFRIIQGPGGKMIQWDMKPKHGHV